MKKPQSLSGYFRRQTNHTQYNLLAAVRGADVGQMTQQGKTLKNHLTGRIRSIIFPRSRTITGIVKHAPVLAEDLPAIKGAIMWHGSPRHYLSHLRDAIHATQGHAIWGGFAGRLIGFMDQRRVKL